MTEPMGAAGKHVRPRTGWPVLASADGQTLVEILAGMVVMAIVMAGLVTAFVNSTRAQTDQTGRMIADDAARTSLIRMRRDIRCASGTPTVTANAYSGKTLSLSVPPTACPAVTTATTGVMWCTIPYTTGSTNRFRLYRETSGNCDGVGATYAADYLTSANAWTVPTCTSGALPTVMVSLPVNTDPVSRSSRTFTLTDTITLRNADLC